MASYLKHYKTAWFFIVPQLLVTLVFFIWPAFSAVMQSFFYSDPFGLNRHFAGFANYLDLFHDPAYGKAVWITFIIAFFVTILTMGFGLLLAYLVQQRQKSQAIYKSMLIWPYAVAPAVAAILWRFLCHPTLGWLAQILQKVGIDFDYLKNPLQAISVVVLTASWQQFSYNFLFYFAAIKAIPQSLIDAAILDGASSWRRFYQIIFPLLSPTTFFLLIMNLIYGFFETFGIIHVMTHGGPGNSTTNLIYKVYQDGFIGMDVGSSSAQSVLLMLIVVGLTLVQFKFIENKVHYK
ncbi:carbohydrate ABC transporter permease [Legionella israelensis]|uniref:sn-glycerol-3-phosphate transport system permease protein UgpA n=1 Tax=Legionella israelensis TaxID=454 RepID=A0A0W0W3P3_9GAMM|nr:ABC transporter permease subunit [Legionella israelensis]KTD26889.1 sn-glycerol-3-phosphate transmembrane ABC transporter [Legionella israelensis]QBS08555.1 ABC transporter permease subunit [Legionella israelensis]QDP72602.1 ABC transporter permease subunit [Legionella israelensis]SCX76192.1 carbohydrate ABC transporter membrane protein 1, CUT1 family (TC 3.A.1.1.-) [Legionella israelensis DSM 19235]STX58207.1 sn-glycerol 3-phosphate transport system permease protein [Legionella israelensis